jgi:PPE-repeat protein
MWIQAATTMSTYQAVSDTAVASAPQTAAAPAIVKSDAQEHIPPPSSEPAEPTNPLDPLLKPFESILQQLGISNSQVAHDPAISNGLDTTIAHMLQNFGYHWNPAAGTLNGEEYDYYTNPGQSIFYVARALEALEDFQQFGVYLTQDPVHAFQYLMSLALFDWPTHIAEFAPALSQSPALAAAAAGVAAAPAGSVGGLAGLTGLAGLPVPAGFSASAVPAPAPVVPDVVAAGTGPGVAAPTAAPAPAPAPVPAASTVAGPGAPPPPPSPPPVSGGVGFVPYVVGPPGMGFGSGMGSSAGSSAKKKAPEPDTAAAGAAAAAATRQSARARRRRRAAGKDRGHADEFMDMNAEVDPDWSAPSSTTASERGAAGLGFAGTAVKDAVSVVGGLTTLTGDGFGGGPREPMLPDTWGDGEAEFSEPCREPE